MGKYFDYIWLMSAAFLMTSCGKQELSSDDGEKIAFYVKSQQAVSASSRALIEDTEDLLNQQQQQQPKLYVTDENQSMTNQEVGYAGNGVWQSDKEWDTSKDYVFYAYIASPIVSNETVGVYVSPGSNGKVITITQPETYQTDLKEWVDYMMSYRVSAKGADKGLVKLDMERVTACVELYMAKSANIEEVTVNSISFNNVITKADFSLQNHATPDAAEGLYGMKNTWVVNVFDDSKKEYTRSGPFTLSDVVEDRFSPEHLRMKFLVVPQTLRDGAKLSINYTVNENGTPANYDSEFILSDYNIKSWDRGHKIRYFIGIDTSVKLEGYVEPWKSVDYIETTLLPND